MDLKAFGRMVKGKEQELGGKNRKLEADYRQGKENNDELKTGGKSRKKGELLQGWTEREEKK